MENQYSWRRIQGSCRAGRGSRCISLHRHPEFGSPAHLLGIMISRQQSLRSVYRSAATIAREQNYTDRINASARYTKTGPSEEPEDSHGPLAPTSSSDFTKVIASSIEARIRFLRSVPLFHSLPEEELKNVCRIFEPVDFEQGTQIICQGESIHNDGGDHLDGAPVFYIITGGEAKVYIRSQTSRAAPDHLGMVVARLTPGDIFGHTALLPNASGVRGGTVVADDGGCYCLVGDRFLLQDIVASIPPKEKRQMFSNFSDLRRDDTASLASYAYQIRKVIETVGADVLAFELEQELLIRKTKAERDTAKKDASIDSKLNEFDEEKGNQLVNLDRAEIQISSADDDWSVLHDPKLQQRIGSTFTESHLELLKSMVDIHQQNIRNREDNNGKVNLLGDLGKSGAGNLTEKRTVGESEEWGGMDGSNSIGGGMGTEISDEVEIVTSQTTRRNSDRQTTRVDPRRNRLLAVNKRILEECLHHAAKIAEMEQAQQTALAQEAIARKKQGSDAAKMHIAGSYVPELSADDMLGIAIKTIAALCEAESIAIFVGNKKNDPIAAESALASTRTSPSRQKNPISISSAAFSSSTSQPLSPSHTRTLPWTLLTGFERRRNLETVDSFYTPSASPGTRFRHRVASRVLRKSSVEIEKLGSGRETMCMSILDLATANRRGVGAETSDKVTASMHRRRGSLSGDVSAGAVLLSSSRAGSRVGSRVGSRAPSRGPSRSVTESTDINADANEVGEGNIFHEKKLADSAKMSKAERVAHQVMDACDDWDSAVVQLIRSEPFTAGEEQVLLAAREYLRHSIWQRRLELLEEHLSSNARTLHGDFGIPSPYESSHRVHKSLQVRLCQVSGVPLSIVAKSKSMHRDVSILSDARSCSNINHKDKKKHANSQNIRESLANKITHKHVRSVFVRARVFHGNQAISSRSVTPPQMPFLDVFSDSRRKPGRSTEEKVLRIDTNCASAFSHANIMKSNEMPSSPGLFMLGSSPVKQSDGVHTVKDSPPAPSKNCKVKSGSTSRADSATGACAPPTVQAQWYEWVDLAIPIQDLPRAAKLVFELVAIIEPDDHEAAEIRSQDRHRSNKEPNARGFDSRSGPSSSSSHSKGHKTRVLGWTVLPLYSLEQVLRSGSLQLHLFPGHTYDLGLAAMFSGLEGGDPERSIMHHVYNASIKRGHGPELSPQEVNSSRKSLSRGRTNSLRGANLNSSRSIRSLSHSSTSSDPSIQMSHLESLSNLKTKMNDAKEDLPAWWSSGCHTKLTIEIQSYANGKRVVYRDRNTSSGSGGRGGSNSRHRLQSHHIHSMSLGGIPSDVYHLLHRSPLEPLSQVEMRSLWFSRDELCCHSNALGVLIRAVDWSRYEQVQELYALLHHWVPLQASLALNLLGAESADPNVRAFAVRQLENLQDAELSVFMLHLTHALKFETFVDSALARFLLRRSFLSPHTIGHALFWCLKSEMSMLEGIAVRHRFGIIMSQYLRCCGQIHREVLGHELWLMNRLAHISSAVKSTSGPTSKKLEAESQSHLQFLLAELNHAFPSGGIRLPLSCISPILERERMSGISIANSISSSHTHKQTTRSLENDIQTVNITSFVVKKCRVLPSEKAPLWLVCNTTKHHNEPKVPTYGDDANYVSQGGDVTILFRNGNHLLREQMVLAMMKVIEDCWLKSGLDLKLQPYGCVSTGDCLGLTEAVPDSITLANLAAEIEKGSRFRIASQDPYIILRWLAKENNFKVPAASYFSDEKKKKKKKVGLMSRLRRSKNPKLNLNKTDTSQYADCEDEDEHNTRAQSKQSKAAKSPQLSEGIFELSDMTPEELQCVTEVVGNFASSCAGSVVLTYVLGIGDRNDNNIMIQKSGRLFHINFENIFGNFKKNPRASDNTTNFGFTPVMANVLYSVPKAFEKFEELACRALNALRSHSVLIISLFSLMISGGIHELNSTNDIRWLEEKLMLDATDDEASSRLREEIRKSLRE